MVLCVVRVRGRIGVKRTIEDTMRMLRLTRVNHCALVSETVSNIGMLRKAKDYVTWGKIDEATLKMLIEKRGRLVGGRMIDEDFLSSLKFASIDDLVKSIEDGSVVYSRIDGIKPIFRLSPPRKGYPKRKRSFREGGSLGLRENMDSLIERMV